MQNSVDTNALINLHIRTVSAENIKFIPDVTEIIKENCKENTFTEIWNDLLKEDPENPDPIEGEISLIKRLKCIGEAITAAVKETDFEGVWDEYKRDLDRLYNRIKACKNESNKWEVVK